MNINQFNELKKRKGSLDIGLDLDGVSVDYVAGLKKFAEDEFGKKMAEHLPNTYSMVEEGYFNSVGEFLHIHKSFVKSGGLATVKLLEDNISHLIKDLQDAGHKVHAITARSMDGLCNNQILDDTIKNMELHNIDLDSLTITHDKHEANCDIYIEDSPKNHTTLTQHGHLCVIRHQPYNANVDGVRVNRFSEFADMILS